MNNLFQNFHFSYMPEKIIEDNFIVSDMMGVINAPDFHYKRTSFNNYLFVYVLDGIFHIKQYGKNLALTKGQSVIMSLRDEHEYFTDKENPAHAVWFHFRGGYIEHTMNFLLKSNCLPLTSSDEAMLGYIEKVFTTAKSSTDTFEYELSSLIYQTVIEISKNTLSKLNSQNTIKNSWFTNRINSYIENNIYKKISLSELSEKVGMKESYFNNVFKNYFNISPHQLILEKKLRFSIELLVTSSKSIGDIAYSLSFTDQSHYTRLFKKMYGINPLKYRKMFKNKQCVL